MGITRSWEGRRREVQGGGGGAGNRRKSLWCSVAQWMKCGGQNLNIHFIYDKEFENVPLGEMACASRNGLACYSNVIFTCYVLVFK